MRKMIALFAALFFPLILLSKEENPAVKPPVVVVETNLGNFELTLKPDVAPKACENFLGLIDKKYYKGVIFHRVIKNFMIQGGDPSGTGRNGDSIWGKPFEDECKKEIKFDKPGLLAMANRGPNTNGSQFFITTAKTPWLHMGHTIFGEVTSGYEVIQKIESTPTQGDRPLEPVQIIQVYLRP